MDDKATDESDGTPEPRKSGLMQRLGILPAVVGGLLAAFVVLGVVDYVIGDDPIPPLYTAELEGEGSELSYLARYAADSRTLTVERVAGEAGEARTLQLWLLPAADGAAPISLGVLPADPSVAFALPAEMVPTLDRGSLAISEEPEGGSPEAGPTGPILVSGEITPV